MVAYGAAERVGVSRSRLCAGILLLTLLSAGGAQEPPPDVPGTQVAEPAPTPGPDYSLGAVLEELRAQTRAARERLAEREARYQSRLDAARTRLAEAQAKLERTEAEGTRLEGVFAANSDELDDKARTLSEKIGALKELFGVFQQNASDLIGAFVGAPTSLQYPNRDRWLEGFAERMKDASEVSSADDIKQLWFEMMREIEASGDIVRLRAPVIAADGSRSERELVRVGNFNLVTAEPEPAYLQWQAGTQQVVELPRQPAGPYLAEIGNFVEREAGLATLSTDPTGGVLLSLLIEKPDTRERVDQGGLVGYMILGLGAMALVLALLKLVDITLISLRVARQGREPENPRVDNSLGRLLLTYQDNREQDAETLAQRLHERVAKESGRVNRFTIFLAIIAAVAPLMGLLGTVVGMINTFQAITLYGTGDPQTMAGGISQALITTVLGLIVAVPAVLLHALVSARGKAVVNVLRQHSAALTGDRLAIQNAAEPRQPLAAAVQPEPVT